MLREQRIGIKPGEVPSDVVTSAYMAAEARSLAANNTTKLVATGREFVMLTGSSNMRLANSVAELLQHKIYYSVTTYPNGCVEGNIPVTVSEKHVIVIQSTQSSSNGDPNDNMAELENIVFTAKKGMGANKVWVVDPAPSDMRSDRKTRSGQGIAAKLHADKIKNAGADRILIGDLHAPQEQGFFEIPLDELYGSYVLLPYVLERAKELNLDLKMGAIDSGAEKRNRAWAKRIDGRAKGEIVLFKKQRDVEIGGKPHIIGVEGDMMGYDMLLADDVYSSGESLDKAAAFAKENGAKSVRAVVVYGEFTGRDGKSAIQLLDESPLDEIIITDAIDVPDEIRNHPKIKIVSVAPLLAEAIYRNLMNISLSELAN